MVFINLDKYIFRRFCSFRLFYNVSLTEQLFCRSRRTENIRTVVLGQPVADPASRDSAGAGEAAGGDSRIRFEVRRAQDENTGDTERLQLLQTDSDEGLAVEAGQSRA